MNNNDQQKIPYTSDFFKFPWWAYVFVFVTSMLIQFIATGFLFVKLPGNELIKFLVPYLIFLNICKLSFNMFTSLRLWLAPSLIFYTLSWFSYFVSETGSSVYFVFTAGILILLYLGMTNQIIAKISKLKIALVLIPFTFIDVILKESIISTMLRIANGVATQDTLTTMKFLSGLNYSFLIFTLMFLVRIKIQETLLVQQQESK